jgi:NAD(P)H-hydrate epimerase
VRPGNNGGDGFVAARHLLAEGWPVTARLLRGAELRGDAARAAGSGRAGRRALAERPGGPPLVVDALVRRRPDAAGRRHAGGAVDRMNQERLSVVAVDVPSGLHGDTGR